MEDTSPSNKLYESGIEGRASTGGKNSTAGGSIAGAQINPLGDADDLFDDDSDDSPDELAVVDTMDSNEHDELMYAQPAAPATADGKLVIPVTKGKVHMRVNSNTMSGDNVGNEIDPPQPDQDEDEDLDLDGMYDEQTAPTTGLKEVNSNHSDLYGP